MALYRRRNIKSKIHKIRPKRSIFRKPWFWVIILFSIIILSGFYVVLFYSGFQIKDILISGNNKIKTQDLQEIVLKDTDAELLNFLNVKIASRSIFLVNKGKINIDILKKFPEIEKLTINRNFPQTLILNVTERKPLGAFCSSTVLGQVNGKCFLIDGAGVIFESLSAAPDNLTVVRQATESGQIFLGQKVLAQNIIDAIYKIQKVLKDNFQIDLTEALIVSPLRLNVTTGEGWKVYFDLSDGSDINIQTTKLNLLLDSEIPAAKRKDLRYIDLRPKDKAIICDNNICG